MVVIRSVRNGTNSSFVLPRIDRWGLIRSTVKNHDSQSEADVEKRKRRAVVSRIGEKKMKQKAKFVSTTEKEINLFLIGFTFSYSAFKMWIFGQVNVVKFLVGTLSMLLAV